MYYMFFKNYNTFKNNIFSISLHFYTLYFAFFYMGGLWLGVRFRVSVRS